MPPRGANSFGTGPSGKGAPTGGSFLSLPKDLVKEPPPRPPPAVITQPPVNKLRQPPLRPPLLKPPTVTPPAGAIGRAAKLLSKVPKAGGAVAGIVLDFMFPPSVGDNYYDRNPPNPPPKYKLQPPEPPQEIQKPRFPFTGGQGAGVRYNVTIEIGSLRYGRGEYYYEYTEPIFTVYGPVEGLLEGPPRDSEHAQNYYEYLVARDALGNIDYKYVTGWSNPPSPYTFRIVSIRRLDNQPDTAGNPPPTTAGINSPAGNTLGAPSAAPPSVAPSPAPTAPPSTLPSPSPSPSPEPKRYPGPIPIPAPPPGESPQPNKYPGPVPNPDPYPAPNGEPAPSPGPGVGAPAPSPTPAPVPKPGPSPYTYPPPSDPTKYPDTGFQPKILTPNPLTPGAGLSPSPVTPNPLAPSPFTPNPNTGNPEPKAPPKVEPPKTPAPSPSPNDDLFKQIQNLIGPVTIALAGITALVQPNALRSAANAGTCDAFAPGGCAAPVANNAQNAANNSANSTLLLARIMAFLEALQTFFLVPILNGVNLINTKLGPVMAGVNGIGGFLARTAEAAKIDKLLGALNTILLLHNAAMLSRNLGSTLGDLTSQALSTIGIKDSSGAPIDVNEILGKQANNFMSSILGAEVWAGTKTSWNKASSIVSSATNIMYTVRSMFDSTREILEWTAENTGKIGNALKRFRVVGENAYKWLPEQVTVQNRFTRQVDRFREGVDELDDAASSLSGVLGEVQSIQQEYADLQEQKQKFDKNISELAPKEREENKPVTDAVTAAKNASKAPSEIENVFRGEGSNTDG